MIPHNPRLKSVLVADGSSTVRNRLKIHFEKLGAKVYSAPHFDKLHPLVRGMVESGNVPDLVILDVRLPGAFGFLAVKQVIESLNGHFAPILVFSWGLSRSAARQLARWGVMAYLEKPCTIQTLDRSVRECLASQS